MGYSTDDHAKRDIVMDIPRDGQIEIGNTGFRFVRIDLLRPDVTIRIREAAAIFRFRDIPYRGSFRCSDTRLDSIWMTGAYTGWYGLATCTPRWLPSVPSSATTRWFRAP